MVTLGSVGVTAMETRTGAVTVNVVEPLTAPSVAPMVEVPIPALVAKPPEVMVALPGVPEAHVTDEVRFSVVLSEKVPVAVNCWVSPLATDGSAGITDMETRLAEVIVNVVEPEMSPSVAVIEEVPAPAPVARPPAVMVALPGVPDAQVTEEVRSWVDPSE